MLEEEVEKTLKIFNYRNELKVLNKMFFGDDK